LGCGVIAEPRRAPEPAPIAAPASAPPALPPDAAEPIRAPAPAPSAPPASAFCCWGVSQPETARAAATVAAKTKILVIRPRGSPPRLPPGGEAPFRRASTAEKPARGKRLQPVTTPQFEQSFNERPRAPVPAPPDPS